MPSISQIRVEGVPPAQDAAFRDAAADLADELRSQPGHQRQLHLHDEAEHPDHAAAGGGRRRRGRRSSAASTSWASPSRASPSRAQNGDQILVQLPGVTDVEHAKEIIRSTGLLELKIVEGGPAATREDLLQNGQVPEGMEIIPGSADATGGGTVYYMVRKAAAVSGRDLTQRAAVGRSEQPAGRQLHAERRRRAEVRHGHRNEHRTPPGDHPRQPRACRRRRSSRASPTTARSPASRATR